MRKTLLLSLISSFFVFVTISDIWGAEKRIIRVGIQEGASSVTLFSNKGMKLVDSSGKKVVIGKTAIFHPMGNRIKVGQSVLYSPIRVYSGSPISYQKRPYLGSFKIVSSGGRLTVINILDIENYLRGVLKMEVNPKWPDEALKAQAIISRTYALKHMGKHRNNGYDLCSKPHCQVYRGINAHDNRTDLAIKATRGLVITYKGKVANTFFHSDSGGITASSQSVWGGSIPYLREVREPLNYSCPYSNWSLTISAKEIEAKLLKKGFSLGKISRISVVKRDLSGRVAQIDVTGSSGSVKLSGNKFRMIIGSRKIKSTLFDVDGDNHKEMESSLKNKRDITRDNTHSKTGELTAEEETQLLIMTKQGLFSPEEIIDMLYHPEKRKKYLTKTSVEERPVSTYPSTNLNYGVKKSYFTIAGHGWGHGVGLSQWGARAMALNGWKVDRILKTYYPGTKIEKTR